MGAIDAEVTNVGLDIESTHVGPVMAHRDTQSRQQLGRRERLGDVVVGAVVEHFDLAMFGVVGGQDDDRDVRPRADPPADFDSVDVGETEVEDHRRRARRWRGVDRLLAARRNSTR